MGESQAGEEEDESEGKLHVQNCHKLCLSVSNSGIYEDFVLLAP